MAELLQAVTHTAYPNGEVEQYAFGMMPKQRKVDDHQYCVWRRWLQLLKHKHHWTPYDEKIRLQTVKLRD